MRLACEIWPVYHEDYRTDERLVRRGLSWTDRCNQVNGRLFCNRQGLAWSFQNRFLNMGLLEFNISSEPADKLFQGQGSIGRRARRSLVQSHSTLEGSLQPFNLSKWATLAPYKEPTISNHFTQISWREGSRFSAFSQGATNGYDKIYANIRSWRPSLSNRGKDAL